MKYQLTVSIVTYKNNIDILQKAVGSVLQSTLTLKLYIIDNSPTPDIKAFFSDPKIEYVFNNNNVGFGKGHNIAIEKSLHNSPYHLVLNPDVYFEEGVLEAIYSFMEENRDVGHIMPKVLYPDGTTQYLCKLLPSPYDLIIRRFLKFRRQQLEDNNFIYELRFSGYNQIMNVPYLSGCFMFLRNESLKKVGLFDERIFMYTEDTDLTRRIHKEYRTLYYPHVNIFHHFAKGSHKSFKLLIYAMHGSIMYFNKWGWFFDRERKKINQNTIKNIT